MINWLENIGCYRDIIEYIFIVSVLPPLPTTRFDPCGRRNTSKSPITNGLFGWIEQARASGHIQPAVTGTALHVYVDMYLDIIRYFSFLVKGLSTQLWNPQVLPTCLYTYIPFEIIIGRFRR